MMTFGPRHTARGIVVHDGKLLLIERWRHNLHYYSIPGGGIDNGETPEQTVLREMREETSIQVRVERPVLEMRDGGTVHMIFLCEYVDGEPFLPADSPEARLNDPNNRFAPKWVGVREVPNLPFIYWQPLKPALLTGLETGFPDDITIVSTDVNR